MTGTDHSVATRTLLGFGFVVLGIALFGIPGLPIATVVGIGAVYWTIGIAGGVTEAGGRPLAGPTAGAVVSVVAVVVAGLAGYLSGSFGATTVTPVEGVLRTTVIAGPAFAFPLGLSSVRSNVLLYGALTLLGVAWAGLWALDGGTVAGAGLAAVAMAVCAVPTAAYGRRLSGQRVPILDD